MNTKAEVEATGLDTIKLLAAVVVLAAGVVGFYYFDTQPLWVRLGGLLVVVAVGVFIAVQTAIGRQAWGFVRDSRTEVRKVVWPSRQETIQTSLVIFVAVLVTALFLWAVDSLLFATVRYLTGQGG
jgi:preprotein translocase subunit SecE